MQNNHNVMRANKFKTTCGHIKKRITLQFIIQILTSKYLDNDQIVYRGTMYNKHILPVRM